MDLFSTKETTSVYTVSEFTDELKSQLESDFSTISIRGEVSNFRPAASGHIYFSLKDSAASISAALFRGSLAKIKNVQLREGVEVICHGRISVYPPRGTYQLIVDQVEMVGAGSLQAKFEALKRKLNEEGLFKAERKREIPRMPQKIAIITSPTGAAIRDVISVLKRRSASFDVLILPALVQGEQAEGELVRALRRANDPRIGAEVILLTRGGGSIEDLWCFNSEKLARAIAASRLPVVSAVGHEIDFTIADFVADFRAATPSAAAEILTKESEILIEMVDELWTRLIGSIRNRLYRCAAELNSIKSKLRNPVDTIRALRRQFAEWRERLTLSVQQNISSRDPKNIERTLFSAFKFFLQSRRGEYERAFATLNALSPVSILDRGYALVTDASGSYLRSADETQMGDVVGVRLSKGSFVAEVKEIGKSR